MTIPTSLVRKYWPRSKRQTLFICSLIILTIFNTAQLIRYFSKTHKIKHLLPFQFSGFKFSGLTETLKGVSHAGYYTDKDLNDKKDSAALKQFSQAQYILAPVILDPDNLDHPFILLDCTSEEVAFKKAEEIGAIPFRKNKYGIILARKPL